MGRLKEKNMTLGTVLAFLSTLVGIGLSSFFAMVLSTLIFSKRTLRGSHDLQQHPWKSLTAGLLLGMPLLLVSIAFLVAPAPVLKAVGFVLLLLISVIALVGAGSLARLLGERIQNQSQSPHSLNHIALGSFIIAGTAVLPLIGWLVFGPLFIIVALGSGMRSLKGLEDESSESLLEKI